MNTDELQTRYIPDEDFAMYIHNLPYKDDTTVEGGDRRELTNIDGYMRWIILPVGEEPYIARPSSAK